MAETAKEIYNEYNPKLVRCLPLKDPFFLAELTRQNFFSGDLKEEVLAASTQAIATTKFLHKVVERSLDIGNEKPFNKLLSVMENFNDDILKELAKEIRQRLVDEETPPFVEALQSGQYHIKWTTCSDLPTPMYDAYVAVSNGIIYCTGITTNKDNWDDVYSFDTRSNQWKQLPRPGHCLGVIHMVDDKLTIFGGYSVTNNIHNKVTTYNSKTNSWYSCYPNMLHNRHKPGVTTSHDHVIVMGGGSTYETDHDNIEVMNYHQLQWKELFVHLPVPMYAITPTITGDYITIVGYQQGGYHYTTHYQIPVQDILLSLDQPFSTGAVTSQWKKLSPAPHRNTVTVPYSNPPVVIGGSNHDDSVPTSDVSLYDSSSNSWRKVGSLTSARDSAGVVLLNSNILIVVGGACGGEGIEAAMASSLTLVEIGTIVANQ